MFIELDSLPGTVLTSDGVTVSSVAGNKTSQGPALFKVAFMWTWMLAVLVVMIVIVYFLI